MGSGKKKASDIRMSLASLLATASVAGSGAG
jgi:hypothetical protein